MANPNLPISKTLWDLLPRRNRQQDISDHAVLADGGSQYESLAKVLAEGAVSVRRFGAVGDGTTDDTAAFVAAIARAVAVSQAVYVPPGTYAITTLTLAAGVVLHGHGEESVLRCSDAAQTTFISVTGVGVSLRRLRFEGAREDAAAVHRGVFVSGGGASLEVSDCTFSGEDATHGFTIQVQLEGDECDILRNRFERVLGTANAGYGVLVDGGSRNRIIGNRGVQTSTAGRHHVYVSVASSDNLVENNYFIGGMSSMIALYALDSQDGCVGNVVRGNRLSGMVSVLGIGSADGAITVTQKVSETVVEDNVILDCLPSGIVIEGSGEAAESRAEDTIVKGNIIRSCSAQGILVKGADRAILSDNIIADNSQGSAQTYPGIQINPAGATAPCNDCVLSGNVSVGSSQRAPFRISTGSGVRPLGTVLRNNHFPKGGFKYGQDDGDRSAWDETYVVKRRLTYTDFAAAALTGSVALHTLGPGERVESVVIKHATAFAGGAISAYTVSVGIAGTAAKYAAAFNVFQAPGATVFQASDTKGFENMAATETGLVAVATAVSANTDQATAGVVEVWVSIRRYAMLTQ